MQKRQVVITHCIHKPVLSSSARQCFTRLYCWCRSNSFMMLSSGSITITSLWRATYSCTADNHYYHYTSSERSYEVEQVFRVSFYTSSLYLFNAQFAFYYMLQPHVRSSIICCYCIETAEWIELVFVTEAFFCLSCTVCYNGIRVSPK